MATPHMSKPSTRTLLGIGLIGLACVVAYSTAMRGGFIWDDDAYVTQNDTLRSFDGLGRIWFEIGATPQYYPMVFTTFWLEYQTWGASPAGYHFINVVLHALSAVLLWFLLRKLSVPGAWLAAAIFALHPVHVESVAWITERKNVLSGVFYLASLTAFLRFAPIDAGERGGPRRFGMYWLALVLFICALLSKTVTCSLPAAILLIYWWKRGTLPRREVLAIVPMLAIGLATAALTVWLERHHVGAEGRDWTLTGIERTLVAGRAAWFYLGKLVLPFPLMFVYPRWDISQAVWWQYLFPAAVVVLLTVLRVLQRRIGRGPLTAALFFGGTLVPALGFIDVYPFRYSFVADHFQYLASIGPIVLIAALLSKALDRFASRSPAPARGRGRKAAAKEASKAPVVPALAKGVVLLVLVVLTARQGMIYRDIETLWRDTLARNPDAWLAHHNLAKILEARGELEAAAKHNRETLRLHPNDPDAHNNLAIVLTRQQKRDEALEHYNAALALKPDLAATHSNMAVLLLNLGRVDEAIHHFRKAIDFEVNHAGVYANLGLALRRRGDLDEAIEAYESAVKLAPNVANIRVDLGKTLGTARRYDEAIAAFRQALVLSPGHADAKAALEATERIRTGG